MEWVRDVSVGDWIKDSLADHEWSSLRSLVPDGFASYARVFHPFTRERPPAEPLAQNDQRFDPAEPVDTLSETVSWAETARAFGTVAHPLAQAHLLIGKEYGDSDWPEDADGWQYCEPEEGQIDIDLMCRLAAVLAEHTTTPQSGYACIWEGWGGLTSAAGRSRFTLIEGTGLWAWLARARLRARALLNRLRAHSALFSRQERPGTGVLSREASAGPRLELPNRDYIVFRAGIDAFRTPAWTTESPWVVDPEFRHIAQTPSIIWPDDRAWVLASEIDFDSTVIGGSDALVSALLSADGIEAARIDLDDPLTHDGDTINPEPLRSQD